MKKKNKSNKIKRKENYKFIKQTNTMKNKIRIICIQAIKKKKKKI